MTRLEDLSERIDSRHARIGVIGIGYVGLPLALEFAKAGFRVTGFELDADKVRTINEGGSYLEDVTAEEVKTARDAGKL
jgi:UDP-N-acetyl-D-glucosamine dehydrogenase